LLLRIKIPPLSWSQINMNWQTTYECLYFIWISTRPIKPASRIWLKFYFKQNLILFLFNFFLVLFLYASMHALIFIQNTKIDWKTKTYTFYLADIVFFFLNFNLWREHHCSSSTLWRSMYSKIQIVFIIDKSDDIPYRTVWLSVEQNDGWVQYSIFVC
jgi:hypothetical protein